LAKLQNNNLRKKMSSFPNFGRLGWIPITPLRAMRLARVETHQLQYSAALLEEETVIEELGESQSCYFN
jgi:hypothetical protein